MWYDSLINVQVCKQSTAVLYSYAVDIGNPYF